MTHTYGDERIVDWLAENGYHPRSPAHGSASCMYFLDDLAEESEAFLEAAQRGDIVYQEDFTVGDGQDRWNTDLVVGPPAEDSAQISVDGDRPIAEGEPEEIWLAVDAKSVMTEHGKARRNRQRDINSFADIMHSHYPGSVTGGILLINMADRFRSPLRDEGDITDHDRIEQLVQETVEIFRTIDRAQGEVSPNVDAAGCVVVEHTNIDDDEESRLVTEPPAPQPGDIVHYQDFVEIIAETFEERWLIGEPPEIESPADSEDLEMLLNHSVVEIAYFAREIADSIEAGDVDEELLEEIDTEITEFKNVLEEVRRQYTD